MLAVRRGDLSRLEPLFDRYHRPLFDYLVRMTGNRAAAEDLVQDVGYSRVVAQGISIEQSLILG